MFMFTGMYTFALCYIYVFFPFYYCAVYLTNKDEYKKKKEDEFGNSSNDSIIER